MTYVKLCIINTQYNTVNVCMIILTGDNGELNNWCQGSLLCCDMNIFTKCLSLRLKHVLSSSIPIDQCMYIITLPTYKLLLISPNMLPVV